VRRSALLGRSRLALVSVLATAVLLTVAAAPATAGSRLLVVAFRHLFMEGFAAACRGGAACIAALEAHADSCFERDSVLVALDSDGTQRHLLIATHIERFKHCIAAAVGVDYWDGIDMPKYILQPPRDTRLDRDDTWRSAGRLPVPVTPMRA